MAKLFLRHRETQRKYQVMKIDKEKNELVLKGPNATFTQELNREGLKKMGYEMVQEEADAQ